MIYVRTPKGQAEIESAARALPQRLRMILLLVDGRRTADALQAMLALATPGTMSELQALGYIAAPQPASTPTLGAASTAPPKRGTFAAIGLPNAALAAAPGRPAAPLAKTPTHRPRSRPIDSLLEESRFKASQMPSRFEVSDRLDDELTTPAQRQSIARSLQRALGPTATPWVRRIDAATTVRELKQVLRDAHQAIAQARGNDMAEEFASRYGKLETLP